MTKKKEKFLAKPTELWILNNGVWEKTDHTTPFGVILKNGKVIDWKEIDLR